MTEWPTASSLSRPDGSDSGTAGGKLVVVGIGPGSPAHLTAAARRRIKTADAVYAAPLYQRFLRRDGLLSGEGDGPTVRDSSRDELDAQAKETFRRVREGETVVHVSGGDPAVYGKSDLLTALAEAEADGEIAIEILPGVTAALGAGAVLGAPLSRDFCTISLSSSRPAEEIERRLTGAARGGFVIALYNVRRSLPDALDVIQDHRAGSVPVALLAGVAREEDTQGVGSETVSVATLETATFDPETPGTMAVVGTEETHVLNPANGGRPFLVTPRTDDTGFEDIP